MLSEYCFTKEGLLFLATGPGGDESTTGAAVASVEEVDPIEADLDVNNGGPPAREGIPPGRGFVDHDGGAPPPERGESISVVGGPDFFRATATLPGDDGVFCGEKAVAAPVTDETGAEELVGAGEAAEAALERVTVGDTSQEPKPEIGLVVSPKAAARSAMREGDARIDIVSVA